MNPAAQDCALTGLQSIKIIVYFYLVRNSSIALFAAIYSIYLLGATDDFVEFVGVCSWLHWNLDRFWLDVSNIQWFALVMNYIVGLGEAQGKRLSFF